MKITVGSGDEAKQYDINRGFLSHKSPFFHAASTNGFAETASGHIKLPEEKPGAFDIFLHWAYTSKVLPILDVEVTRPEVYLHAMVLADKLLVPDLIQLCWIKIQNWFSMTEFPTPNFIKELYALSPSIYCIANARNYFVAMVRVFIASNMHFDKWDVALACNESFATDVARLIATKQRNRILKGTSGTRRQHFVLDSHPFCKGEYAKSDENVEVSLKTWQIRADMGLVMAFYASPTDWNSDSQFSTWKLIKPSKEDMLAAGFYDSNGNRALCIVCGRKYLFKEGNDPLKTHRFQRCELMALLDAGVRIPLFDDYRRGVEMKES